MALNIKKTELLKPKVRELAIKLANECKKVGYNFAFVETFRSISRQNELYAQGRTKPGAIVTNAKGGYSLHNYGVAFDICAVIDGKLNWSKLGTFDAIGKIGMSIGLEWGGSWTKFLDRPHFQYTAGYTINDFRNKKIDWSKFKLNKPIIIPQANALKSVLSRETLPVFKRILYEGISGPDVKRLQQFLNLDLGTRVSVNGAGFPGRETNYFGPRTKRAVQKFQKKYNITFHSIDILKGRK